jgi:uncharacterized protein (TIGR00725 family)
MDSKDEKLFISDDSPVKTVLKNVTFFGYAESHTDDAEYIGAYQSAQLVAKSGRTIINGGGPGVMYAASKGAKDAGGRVEVVYYVPTNATHFEGRHEPTIQFADAEYQEANYIERTRRLIEMGDAYVVFNGGTGTVSEFAMAWCIARLYFGHHKPLIFYGAFWKNILDAFWNNMRVREEEYRVFKYAVTPEQVVQHLNDYEKMFNNHKGHQVGKDCIGPECDLFLDHHEKISV